MLTYEQLDIVGRLLRRSDAYLALVRRYDAVIQRRGNAACRRVMGRRNRCQEAWWQAHSVAVSLLLADSRSHIAAANGHLAEAARHIAAANHRAGPPAA